MSLAELLRAAYERRTPVVSKLEMYRLFDGIGDGRAGLYIDKIGPFCLAHWLGDVVGRQVVQEELAGSGNFFSATVGVECLYLRIHEKDPKRTSSGDALLVCGNRITEARIKEHGVSLLVRPEANLNAGVFLDTRDVRAYLVQTSRNAKVLNTFCFTGSLGIAAYVGGAREVIQVDSSQAALKWAKENFAINSTLGTGEMRFITDDCITYLRREARRIQEGSIPYDIVIIDPPSFGRSRRKTFRLAKDLPELVALAFSVLGPASTLILCANSQQILPSFLAQLCRTCAANSGLKIVESRLLSAPREDFTSPLEHSISMRGVQLRLKAV